MNKNFAKLLYYFINIIQCDIWNSFMFGVAWFGRGFFKLRYSKSKTDMNGVSEMNRDWRRRWWEKGQNPIKTRDGRMAEIIKKNVLRFLDAWIKRKREENTRKEGTGQNRQSQKRNRSAFISHLVVFENHPKAGAPPNLNLYFSCPHYLSPQTLIIFSSPLPPPTLYI